MKVPRFYTTDLEKKAVHKLRNLASFFLILFCYPAPPGTTLVQVSADTTGIIIVRNQQRIKATLDTSFTGTPAEKGVPQNPSPMVERTRLHERVEKQQVPGMRFGLSLGELFVPAEVHVEDSLPLIVHFHGAPWLVQYSLVKSGRRAALLTIQIGAGSGVYRRAFENPERFDSLLAEARAKLSRATDHEVRWSNIALTAWSAGYGAIREILSGTRDYDRVSTVLLLDGLHTDYLAGWEPEASYRPVKINADQLAVFLRLAQDAVAGKKTFWVLHSEIFPGTFSSTTETADYLLEQLGLKRTPVLRWGPVGMQQLSEASKGGLRVLGFAGNSAPDHLDFIHGFWKWLEEIPLE